MGKLQRDFVAKHSQGQTQSQQGDPAGRRSTDVRFHSALGAKQEVGVRGRDSEHVGHNVAGGRNRRLKGTRVSMKNNTFGSRLGRVEALERHPWGVQDPSVLSRSGLLKCLFFFFNLEGASKLSLLILGEGHTTTHKIGLF